MKRQTYVKKMRARKGELCKALGIKHNDQRVHNVRFGTVIRTGKYAGQKLTSYDMAYDMFNETAANLFDQK